MQLQVRSVDGTAFWVAVEAGATIGTIKRSIERQAYACHAPCTCSGKCGVALSHVY